jgi:hypothetical protein
MIYYLATKQKRGLQRSDSGNPSTYSCTPRRRLEELQHQAASWASRERLVWLNRRLDPITYLFSTDLCPSPAFRGTLECLIGVTSELYAPIKLLSDMWQIQYYAYVQKPSGTIASFRNDARRPRLKRQAK